jgi:hypothetical protein
MSIVLASSAVSAAGAAVELTATEDCGRIAAYSCAQPVTINGAIAHKAERFKLQLLFFMVISSLMSIK